MSKLIISYGITGSRIQKKDTPFIPITPEEIAVSIVGELIRERARINKETQQSVKERGV